MLRDTFHQFIIFCAVGIVNTLAGLSVILILSEILGVHYILSNILGYGVGLVVAFILHRRITFKLNARDDVIKNEIGKFTLVFIICYLIQLGCLYLFVEKIGIYQSYAQFLGLGIYTVLNYIGHRIFTFNHAKLT
jgi:putative flippase GtrA